MIKVKQTLLCLLVAFLISGCSIRFFYNHLDWWANWYLDDYVSLNSQQRRFFEDTLDSLHQWHRKTQLPLYSDQLKSLKIAVNAGIDEQQLIVFLATLADYWQSILIAAEPKLRALFSGLSVEQKQQFLKALDAANQDKISDHKEQADQQWLAEGSINQQAQLAKWFGKLSEQQNSQIALMSQEFQRSFRPWMNYRQYWLSQFSELLEGGLPNPQFKLEFYRLFVNSQSLKSDDFKNITTHNNRVFAKIFVHINTLANDKQRKHINARLDKMINDLVYLANDE